VKKLRVISLLDAAFVTGPAKNVIQFCKLANEHEDGVIDTLVSTGTIVRAPGGSEAPVNPFITAVQQAGIGLDVMTERFRYDPSVVGQLRRLAEKIRPDVIETHGVRMHFMVKLAGLPGRVPWLAFHHGYTTEDLKMRAYNQLDRWSLRDADYIFTDCGPFADQLEGMGINRNKIEPLASSIRISPGASREQIAELRSELKLVDGEPVILSVGRLSGEKAHSDLIKAAALLKAKTPDRRFKLIFVGDGPERERLQQGAASAGLAASVILAGQQNDVRPYYGIASLFVLPSLSEGSPNVLLEAMAAGVPIVSTRVGGVPEMLVDDWSGLMVAASRPDELAHAIERVLTESGLGSRLQENAGRVVREKFSPESYRRTVVRKYGEIQSR
jgi:glycosyltransferase involved in cell wall biosynthesis